MCHTRLGFVIGGDKTGAFKARDRSETKTERTERSITNAKTTRSPFSLIIPFILVSRLTAYLNPESPPTEPNQKNDEKQHYLLNTHASQNPKSKIAARADSNYELHSPKKGPER